MSSSTPNPDEPIPSDPPPQSEEERIAEMWAQKRGNVPTLQPHTQFRRHRYRGEVWYVATDAITAGQHRFPESTYRVIGRIDGHRTLEELYETLQGEMGEDAPTQRELLQLMAQLRHMNIVQGDGSEEIERVIATHRRSKQQKKTARLASSPLFWRVPLIDPDRVLTTLTPMVSPLFSRFGALLWLAVVGSGLFLFARHFGEFTGSFTDEALGPDALIALIFIFPIIKALHELGHAFAVKAFGGEVPEMGILFLVLAPFPYVDASASNGFSRKRERIIVAAGGMIVEIFLASIAMIVWATTEPGWVRSVAYDVVFMSGVATLLFNANPLMKFDGYYILSDVLEIPNLQARSARFLSYLVERFAFGLSDVHAPNTAPGERRWLFIYGIASKIYRVFLTTGIILYVCTQYFFVGVLLALWCAGLWIALPIFLFFRKLLRAKHLAPVRARAIGVTALTLIGIGGFIGFVPLPHSTVVPGYVDVPAHARVRAGVTGTIVQAHVRENDRVVVGQPLLVCKNDALEAEREVAAAELGLHTIDEKHSLIREPARLGHARAQLKATRERVDTVNQQFDRLEVSSGAEGTFVSAFTTELAEQHVLEGQTMGYVVPPNELTIVALAPAELADRIGFETRRVEVRLAQRPRETLIAERRDAGRLTNEPPEAGPQLPLVPDEEGRIVLATDILRTELVVADCPIDRALIHGRADVRFVHPRSPLLPRMVEAAHRLFLSLGL